MTLEPLKFAKSREVAQCYTPWYIVVYMRTARFFVSPEWIALGAQAFSIPAGPMYRQIVTVLRMKVGDVLSLCPNDGSELDCRITEMTKAAILGSINGVKTGKPLRPQVTVCVAVTKRDTFEWVLQKCTELGASAFIPMITDRVIKKIKDVPARWRDIVREASEQSGRMTLPTVSEPMSFLEAFEHMKAYDRIVLHESVGESTDMPKVREMDHIALFIGPEGGFTDSEIEKTKGANTKVVQLGSLVLRAETAAVVATAFVRLGRV
ncbi:MAG: RsmE family RNA methyltransferase [Patescibacteria group bacterium]